MTTAHEIDVVLAIGAYSEAVREVERSKRVPASPLARVIDPVAAMAAQQDAYDALMALVAPELLRQMQGHEAVTASRYITTAPVVAIDRTFDLLASAMHS